MAGDPVEVAAATEHHAGETADDHRDQHPPPPGLPDRDLHLAGIGVADIVGVFRDAFDQQLGEHAGTNDGVMDHASLRDRHELLRRPRASRPAATPASRIRRTPARAAP